MSTNGYHSYNGRGSSGKTVLIVLLMLILIAAVGFLVLQQYIVYDDSGRIRLELPFMQKDVPAPEPVKEPTPAAPPEELEILEPAPPPKPTVVQIETLPAALWQGDSAAVLTQLEADGCNAFAITLKGSDGKLLYPSHIEGAVAAGAVIGNEEAQTALDGLLAAEGYYSVARISALHDSAYAFANMADAGICQASGYIWYDYNSTHWLDPGKEAARRYVCDIAAECAAMGFDEVLLDDFTFPLRGRLGRIDLTTTTTSKTEGLNLLADEVRAALDEQEVTLSVCVSPELILAGSDETSGLVLADLQARFDRIYTMTTVADLPALQAAFAGTEAELVPILSEESVEGSYLRMK